MDIDPATLPAKDAYLLMTACVIPRPIAWTSTIDPDGVPNLAPFSFFGGVCTAPMTVMVSVGRRKGAHKDTSANLLATGEAVVHIVHRPLAEAMVQTAADAEPDVSEFDLAGLSPLPSLKVKPLRIAEAAIAMETVVDRHLEVGDAPVDLFLLRVVHLHVADAFVREGRPDPASMRAVGRLGGTGYCDTAAPFEVTRPAPASS